MSCRSWVRSPLTIFHIHRFGVSFTNHLHHMARFCVFVRVIYGNEATEIEPWSPSGEVCAAHEIFDDGIRVICCSFRSALF